MLNKRIEHSAVKVILMHSRKCQNLVWELPRAQIIDLIQGDHIHQ